ncbi:Vacuolar protein-sorting-associated protein 28 [Dinochytrium kinnereticum]|nr:Vacuolar protein-sorting-associated protein 28 [Dinochytrium kinnereticum]
MSFGYLRPELDQEIKLTSTNAERETYETLAELFSIFVVTEALEKAYIRDAITAQEYTPACTKLIAQFKTARDLYGKSTTELEKFLKDNKLNCPAASKRLIEIGVPATVEHAVAESGTSRQHVKLVADTTTAFITLMDSIKLNMIDTDQIHPLLSDLIQLLNKVSKLPPDFENHKRKIKDWLITLNKMKASDGLSDDQSRQLLFELDSANQAFHNALDL